MPIGISFAPVKPNKKNTETHTNKLLGPGCVRFRESRSQFAVRVKQLLEHVKAENSSVSQRQCEKAARDLLLGKASLGDRQFSFGALYPRDANLDQVPKGAVEKETLGM